MLTAKLRKDTSERINDNPGFIAIHIFVGEEFRQLADQVVKLISLLMFLQPALQHRGLGGIYPRVLKYALRQKPEFIM